LTKKLDASGGGGSSLNMAKKGFLYLVESKENNY
jgi:hypothetical protein